MAPLSSGSKGNGGTATASFIAKADPPSSALMEANTGTGMGNFGKTGRPSNGAGGEEWFTDRFLQWPYLRFLSFAFDGPRLAIERVWEDAGM
jgi:hypothetical protein